MQPGMQLWDSHREQQYEALPDSSGAPNNGHTKMNQLGYRIAGYFLQHQEASEYYDRMFKTLAIPTLIVTSCVPVLEVLMPDTELESAGVSMRKVAVVLCGMMGTLLVGINNMFEFQSKRDQHRNAAKACQTLKHSFVNNVEVPVQMNLKSEATALVDFAQQVEQAVGDHPMVPAWVRKKIPVVMKKPQCGTPQDSTMDEPHAAFLQRQRASPQDSTMDDPLGEFVQRVA